ncbi:MAG: DUF3520 domain-containing protein, partial [Bacteroidales bacterium]|nr:DUF3520 domain-containing protein [Bacteroidales bacterium]
VGYGAYNDSLLTGLAKRGDGRYVFLDSPAEAQRIFVDQFAATLHTVAKDARIQVEFNPERVRRYRLIGYERRDIADKDFHNDRVDAGEVGSGQCSTALYEVELIPPPLGESIPNFGTVSVRYRDTETNKVEEISQRLTGSILAKRNPEDNPRFFLAASAAGFAEWLRDSEHARGLDYDRLKTTIIQVQNILPLDRDIAELAELIRTAEHLPMAP